LSLVVFLTQLIVYTPSFHEPFEYVSNLAGSGQEGFAKRRIAMLLTFFIRAVVIIGPALLAGLLMGIYAAIRRKRLTPATAGIIAYVMLWGFSAMLLTFLFNREKWVFTWMIFPAAYLTACWLSTVKTRAIGWGLLLLALPSLIYVQWTASLPTVSRTSETLARYLAQQTKPEDLVLTNLKPQTFPFPYWDQSGCGNVAKLADRLLYANVVSVEKLNEPRAQLRGQMARTLYLREMGEAIDDVILQQLRDEGHLLARAELPLPVETETFGLRLRSFYWKLQGKATGLENGVGNLTNRVVSLELYSLD